VKVGISYSWDDEAHQRWVATLASVLDAAGFAVELDTNVRLGSDLHYFMEGMVARSDRVLVICTPNYKSRVDARSGGAGFEGTLITAELVANHGTTKFVPLLRSGTWNDAIPCCLAGRKGLDLRNDNDFATRCEELIRDLSQHSATPVLSGKAAVTTAKRVDAVVDEVPRVLGPPYGASADPPVQEYPVARRQRGLQYRRHVLWATIAVLLTSLGAWAVYTYRSSADQPPAPVDTRYPLPPGATVAIRVVAEGSERPVAGASVFVHKAGEGVCGPLESNGDGVVYCSMLSGDYEIVVHYEGMASRRPVRVTRTGTIVTMKIARP